MSSFDIDVLPIRESWVVRSNGRIVSGSPEQAQALRIARYAAENLTREGHAVRLRLMDADGAARLEQHLSPRVAEAA